MFLIPQFHGFFFKNKDIINQELQKAVEVECSLVKAKKLLRKGANPNIKLKKDGATLLHSASTADITKLLLSHGADVNACNVRGETALCVAVMEGKDLTVIRTLLDHGADVNIPTLSQATVLHYASKEDVVNELLSHNPEIDARNSNGFSPLCTAIRERKEFAVIRALLAAGASANFSLKRDRKTLLHCACSAEVVRELIAFGANVNTVDVLGQTPLIFSVVEKKNFRVIQELLKHGANVNATDLKDNGALSYAISDHPDIKLIRELMEYKAQISIGGFHSPLHKAVHYSKYCSELLIKCALLHGFDQVNRDVLRSIIHLDQYSYLCQKLTDFLDSCICEITLMKSDMFNNTLSFYEIAKKKTLRIRPLYKDYTIEVLILTKYPIYHDVIWPKIKASLDRARLLKRIIQLEIGVGKHDNINLKDNYVVLNSDCVQEICEYLSNRDLTNWIAVFDNSPC